MRYCLLFALNVLIFHAEMPCQMSNISMWHDHFHTTLQLYCHYSKDEKPPCQFLEPNSLYV